jgi:hypothetical protein
MPTISIFFGFVVQMYWREHPPPHVHVFYQGFEALIAIENGDVIAGSLPPAARCIAYREAMDRAPAPRVAGELGTWETPGTF